MRHWNSNWKYTLLFFFSSFYPTYEALKLCLRYMEGLLQNSFYPTYEALKPTSTTCWAATVPSVFTLPMRHWNRRWKIGISKKHSSFYPTYEALKLTLEGMEMSGVAPGFYPTYEALKLIQKNGTDILQRRFYPTYEALKRIPKIGKLSGSNGVFTLPMRHWNYFFLFLLFHIPCRFLPYLWGIETGTPRQNLYQPNRFLPYLWGIETERLPPFPIIQNIRFYPTYEALKHCCW